MISTNSSSSFSWAISDNFSSNNLDNWTQFSVEGEQVWDITPYGNPAPSARISGYAGGNVVNEELSKSVIVDMNQIETMAKQETDQCEKIESLHER